MKLFLAAFAASLVDASAVQLPLNSQEELRPAGKPLVTSDAIQGDIIAGNLLNRAYHLSDIADLGIEEYGHPTRVIGSQGNKLPLTTNFIFPISKHRNLRQ
jgi:aminopeptidase Y